LILRGELGGCGSVSLKAGDKMKSRNGSAPQRSVPLSVGYGFTHGLRVRETLDRHFGEGLPAFVRYRNEDAIAWSGLGLQQRSEAE